LTYPRVALPKKCKSTSAPRTHTAAATICPRLGGCFAAGVLVIRRHHPGTPCISKPEMKLETARRVNANSRQRFYRRNAEDKPRQTRSGLGPSSVFLLCKIVWAFHESLRCGPHLGKFGFQIRPFNLSDWTANSRQRFYRRNAEDKPRQTRSGLGSSSVFLLCKNFWAFHESLRCCRHSGKFRFQIRPFNTSNWGEAPLG
jgi:hypothetical protein